jgi:hypothetical protein
MNFVKIGQVEATHALFTDINKLLSLLPTFISQFVWNWYKILGKFRDHEYREGCDFFMRVNEVTNTLSLHSETLWHFESEERLRGVAVLRHWTYHLLSSF